MGVAKLPAISFEVFASRKQILLQIIMTQSFQQTLLEKDWRFSRLPVVLAGDITAAAISATAISPLITAIDRYVNIVFVADIGD